MDGRTEHFYLIRHNPEYRNFLMLEEMRAEMQPALCNESVVTHKETVFREEVTDGDFRKLKVLVMDLQNQVKSMQKKKGVYDYT